MTNKILADTVTAMMAPGKGILAIDESLPTIEKRFASINLESTVENRRAYRELLLTSPDSADYISGMILFDETLRQSSGEGVQFVDILLDQGIAPGIKVDRGAKVLAAHANEKITEGLDGLRERLVEYKALGVKFAKWRAVITIGEGIPSPACIQANTHALARYAALCQEAGIVPMVEPEVLMDGAHTIERCYQVTRDTLHALFQALHDQSVMIEYTILKTNMVIAGKQCPVQADIEQVAEGTVRCLKQVVPAGLAGIVFLSGGQSSELATAHLNAMNSGDYALPWRLSFSYGRALQDACLRRWGGQAANIEAAQASLRHRERCNALACLGQYTASMEGQPGQ